MTKLNIHEAKTQLSKYLARVQDGELIVLCKNGKPIAQMIPYPKKKKKRSILGAAKGMGKVGLEILEPLSVQF